MNTRQFRYVMALAEYKRFATVAKKFFVSQSSVSKQIRALEEELGVLLFRRTRHGVDTTTEGAVIVEALNKCKKIFTDTLEKVLLRDVSDNKLFLGFLESFDSRPELLKAMKTLRDRCGDTDITVSSYTYKGLMDVVNERKADVFFCPEECADKELFETHFLWEASQALMVPADHELAAAGDINGYDFSDERFMMISIGPSERRETVDKLKKAFNIREHQVSIFENMANFSANIEALRAVSIIPMLDVYINDPRFRFLPVDPLEWPPCRVVAAWRRDSAKPALVELITIIKQVFQQAPRC